MSKENTNIPYTYLIGWTSLNKFYYGVRYSKNCNPSDLWKTYFTSSKYVKQFRENFGEPDIIKVRRRFETKEQAFYWEYKVMRRMNVVKSDKWLNKNTGGKEFNNLEFFDNMTEDEKKKYSLKLSKSAKVRFDKMSYDEKIIYAEKHKKIALIPENRERNSASLKLYWETISIEDKQKFIENCTLATQKSKEKRQSVLKQYNDNLSIEEREERKQRCIEVENRPEKMVKRKALSSNVEYINNLSKQAIERYKDVDFKESWLSVTQSEEVNKKRSESVRKAYENKDVIDNHKNAVSSIESRTKLSESSKKKFNDPEFRKAFDERMRNEDYKKKQSEMMKAKCSDPDYIELMKERARKGIETRRRNKELKNQQAQS
ncbi:MAG: hypothetical protein WC679_01020 [Bacteroidales bacterium]|jgi:hypothetical protein